MRRDEHVPYIGITDFTSADQVQQVLRVPEDCDLNIRLKHVLGVGVMMSNKTLRGIPSSWSKAFPPNESVADIFIDDPRVINVLHYADYDSVTAREDYAQVIKFGGPNLDAVQLDMIWPDVKIISAAFRKHRVGERKDRLKIILQVGSKAMERCDDDPDYLALRLSLYYAAGCLDYVLFDKSGGHGKGMDAELLLAYYRAIRKLHPPEELGVVVAGGLGPTRMNLLEPFRREKVLADISTDAQGKLRPSGDAHDPLDMSIVKKYYAESCMFFDTQ